MSTNNTFTRRSFVATAAIGGSLMNSTLRAFEPRSSKIRIGQIGVAHGHANKLAVYRAAADYEVVGIVEPDAQLRSRAEKQSAFRDLNWMTQEQLLSQPDLDAVLIETTPRDSLDVAEACIAAGKHIHLDKPAGQSLSQFERILAAAEQKNLLVQMGYMYRYNPAIELLRQFLRDGWLGEVFELHAVMSKVLGPADRRELAQYAGGMMFELGCHLMDLVVGLLGEPQRITGYARPTAGQADHLVDNALAVLEYPHAIASIKSAAVEVEGFARRHLVVCGTRGTFHIQPLDDPAARIALDQPRGNYRAGYQEVTFPKYSRYVGDAADMVQILRGHKRPDYSYQHDLAVQRSVLAACQTS
ncbi:MAG: Gfo/Idh/MocA family oxidoreductase [Pirellulaceae bacterium]|nr:Gfo/Idh/MocA family oxidoreductase [Pirellulaceae bacterium]